MHKQEQGGLELAAVVAMVILRDLVVTMAAGLIALLPMFVAWVAIRAIFLL